MRQEEKDLIQMTMVPTVSASAAAKLLGVSSHTVRNWIKEGKIRALNIPGTYRILWSDIQDMLSPRNGDENSNE